MDIQNSEHCKTELEVKDLKYLEITIEMLIDVIKHGCSNKEQYINRANAALELINTKRVMANADTGERQCNLPIVSNNEVATADNNGWITPTKEDIAAMHEDYDSC